MRTTKTAAICMTAAEIRYERKDLSDPICLALACLEAAIGLADDVDPPFAANNAAVPVPIFQ